MLSETVARSSLISRLYTVWPAIMTLAVLGVGIPGYLFLSQPPALRTHQDVIRYELSRRSLAARELTTSLPWPDGVNYYAYGAGVYPYRLDVELVLTDGRRAGGIFECRDDQRDCRLTVEDFGIVRQPVPDVQFRSAAWLRMPPSVERTLRRLEHNVRLLFHVD